MKKMNRLLLALAALALVLALGGCEILEEVSAQDRMDDFIADVNGGNYDLQKHTSPAASQYSAAGDESFWNTRFSSYIPLSGLTEEYENKNAASYTVDGDGVTFTFVLIKVGNSFLIQTITRDLTVIFE